nr:MAG TPA: hypothetical protein [Caudoviricetes sp.]DAV08254.1 MAG TPA: hypothetical protein [Caudoviricetes sp.]
MQRGLRPTTVCLLFLVRKRRATNRKGGAVKRSTLW